MILTKLKLNTRQARTVLRADCKKERPHGRSRPPPPVTSLVAAQWRHETADHDCLQCGRASSGSLVQYSVVVLASIAHGCAWWWS